MNFRAITLLVVFFVSFSANAQDIFKNEEQRQAVFRIILSDELKEIYDNIFVPLEKENWEHKYWKVFDPTPGTERNEIYDEFIDRVLFANKYYSNVMSPLFLDDRGKYYVKYGKPDEKVILMGVGKPYQDNETWAYYRYNLFIDFVDQTGFGFREVPSLLDAISAGPSSQKTPVAAGLYVERETLHQKYSSFRDIVEGYAGATAEALYFQLTREIGNEKRIALESAPPSNYDYSYKKERLDANITSAIFRGEHGQSRVELYFSFPLNQLKFQPGKQMPFESLVEKQLTFFNEKFDKIFDKSEKLKLLARNENEIEKRIYINQHNEQIPPGLYNLALQLDGLESNRLAILRAQLKVRDFTGDSLIMSDMQISPQIRGGVYTGRNLKPNGILVVPYIGNMIRRTKPISIYFEIYNLKLNEQGETRFNVAYEVRSLSKEQTSVLGSAIQFISHLVGKGSEQRIGSSFESTDKDEFQQIYLSIDFSKFSSGLCSLNISITDLESGAVTVGHKRLLLK